MQTFCNITLIFTDQDLKIETEEVVRIMVELVRGLQILHQVVVQDLAQEGLIVVVGSTVAQIHAIGTTSTKGTQTQNLK